jgi:eight-cysteine-cluster-containing protein
MKFLFVAIVIIMAGILIGYHELQAPVLIGDLATTTVSSTTVPAVSTTTPGANGPGDREVGGIEQGEPAPVPVLPPAQVTPTAKACVRGGCSGQLCMDAAAEPLMTTCEWRESYACYQAATCEVQMSGDCGWTTTDSLTQCLAEAT